MTNEQLMAVFIQSMESQGKSTNTIRNYKADIKHFEKFLGGTTGGGGLIAAQKTITKYTQQMKKSGLAASTVNRRIQSLKNFYEALKAASIIEYNPMTEEAPVKAVKIAKQNETRWLERNQVKQIFQAIDETKQGEGKRIQQRAIFTLLVNCGFRVQELCNIKMDDIDWANHLIGVVGKGGKFRKVPFNLASQNAVYAWLRYRDTDTPYLFHSERSPQMTPRAIQHMTKNLSEKLNFDFTVHQLRHTALKNIADTTGKIEIVAAVAGHENVNTSRRYIEPSLKEIGEAMKGNEYDY